jgi:hypothetical protein
MFNAEVSRFLNPEFLFGFLGGILITALLTNPLKSFFADKMGRALKQWEKVACAFVAAFVVAITWSMRTGMITWVEIPGNVIVYGTISGFVYENVIKPWQEKRHNG